MFTTYVLYLEDHNKIYIGYSSNIESRLFSHNHEKNKGWTKRYQPWVILHTEEFVTKSEAMVREKYFKTGVGREFIWNIVKEKYGV